MKQVYLASGNPHKVNEISPFFPGWDLQGIGLDLYEIQSMDLLEICQAKAASAFKILEKPVLVEDTAFGLHALNGLPGPFIKFFEERLGEDALVQLLKPHSDRHGVAMSCVVYQDDEHVLAGFGTLKGLITNEAKEGEGFGFDCCFVPEGKGQTFSQMGLKLKQTMSHRTMAIQDLVKQLERAGLLA